MTLRKLQHISAILPVLLMGILTGTLHATTAVKVHFRDQTTSASNQSTPRIYIENTGTETITDFTFRYYFTTEDGKTPVLEDWDTPDCDIMLVPSAGGYYIRYSVSGANLLPGGLLPYSAGNVVGLHYGDWSAWDKTNDFSNTLNDAFAENSNIPVYVGGAKIYGNEPSTTSGSVLREVWTNISGTSVDVIPVTTTPQISGTQSNLDAPRNYLDNYGARIRGYITAPATGDYIFWLASDDNAKFWLSTDATPAQKVLLTSVSTYTEPEEWFKESTQKSSAVTLTEGTKYYFEILHKDGDQNDLCIVKWCKPGENTGYPVEVVPSSVLSPYAEAVVPAAPENLVATAIASQQITLSWNDMSNNECGFMIEMANASGGFSQNVMVTANQTAYTISGLDPELLYKFKVRAYNVFGTSDYTDVAQTTTFAVPEGTVTREVWYNVPGTHTSEIPLTTPPTSVSEVTALETPAQSGDYFGERMRGYIIPPQSGEYIFWIASDDNGQLWLSTDDDPANKAFIAYVQGYTEYREWNKYSSQKSAPVTLTAGVRYYVEVLHKEGNQNDHLSVWWSKPGENTWSPAGPIPASSLSPWIIPSLPDAPVNCVATPVSATQIDITWSDASNNEQGFRIERKNGDGSFVEVGTATENATIFHDAGLLANTQYQYRVHSYNALGNSEEYSDIATAITLEPQEPLVLPQALYSFAIYSEEKSILKDGCIFNGGGAVGSNNLVEIFPQATVNGNVVSGKNVTLKSQSVVNGTVTAADTVAVDAGATALAVEEYAQVAIVQIPEKENIPLGTESKTIEKDVNLPLSPGYYNDLLVKTGGTLTLTAGHYTFTSFYLQTEAKVLLDVATSDMIDIDIAGECEFSDRSEVIFKDKGYVPFIRFYTNDANTVRIGCDVKLSGMLTAPHADIAMYSRAQCSGALYGNTITIEPDAIILSGMLNPEDDSDGDGIQNVLEALLGSEMNDANSFVPIAIPSRAWFSETDNGPIEITYDYSRYYPDEFPTATAVRAVIDPSAMAIPNIPPIIQMVNVPESGELFHEEGYTPPRGRYFEVSPLNSIKYNTTMYLGFPKIKTMKPDEPTWFAGDNESETGYSVALARLLSYDGEMTTSATADQLLQVKNNGPFVATDKEKSVRSVLYFDNGVVFTESNRNRLHYNVKLSSHEDSNVDSAYLRINYTNMNSGEQETSVIILDYTVQELPGLLYSFQKESVLEFENDIVVNTCSFDIKQKNGERRSYVQDCGNVFKISEGKTLQLVFSAFTGEFYSQMAPNRIALYFAQDFEFESASFGEGRILSEANGGIPGNDYTYEYYLTDHLGSTRMVINDQHIMSEAIMYQPYGTMTEIGLSGELPVREKFTTKEFDQDGPDMGTLDFEMTFDFGTDDPVDLDPEKWNAIGVYYTDTSLDRTEQVGDIIPIVIDEGNNTGVAKASINYTADKQVKWIGVVVNGYNMESTAATWDINCRIVGIDQYVGPDSVLTISKVVDTSSDLTANIGGWNEDLAKDILEYSSTGSSGVAGIGMYYFAARYYDPVIGTFTSTDPADEVWNAYGYCGNSPINFIDPTGAIIEGFNNPFLTAGQIGLNWLVGASEAQPWLIEAMWNSPFTFNRAWYTAFATGLDWAPTLFTQAMGNVLLDGLKGWGNSYMQLNNNVNTLLFGDGVEGFNENVWFPMAEGIGEGIMTGQFAMMNRLTLLKNVTALRGAAKGGSNAFNIAKSGGKHAGQLNQFMKQTPKQLQKTINTFNKQIAKHKGWIQNPSSKVKNFNSLSPTHQKNLIHHWQQDILRQQDLKSIANQVLKGL